MRSELILHILFDQCFQFFINTNPVVGDTVLLYNNLALTHDLSEFFFSEKKPCRKFMKAELQRQDVFLKNKLVGFCIGIIAFKSIVKK